MRKLLFVWAARLFVIGGCWWMATGVVFGFMGEPFSEYGLRLALGLLHLLCVNACDEQR